MAIGHITGKNEETEKFICLPQWAVSGPIEGISIHKEDFQPGKRVKIVQIGHGTTIEPEFGFVDAESPLLGVLPVPEAFKQQMMQVSPNHAVLAYIAAKINRVQSIYWRAKVVDNAGPRLLVNLIDGERAGQSDILLTIPIAAEEYEVDEIVLVDRISYDTPAVVGWWEPLKEAIQLILNVIGGGAVTGAGEYNAGDEVTASAFPDTDFALAYWLEDGAIVSYDEIYGFIIQQTRHLTAVFKDTTKHARVVFSPITSLSWRLGMGLSCPYTGFAFTTSGFLHTGITFAPWLYQYYPDIYNEPVYRTALVSVNPSIELNTGLMIYGKINPFSMSIDGDVDAPYYFRFRIRFCLRNSLNLNSADNAKTIHPLLDIATSPWSPKYSIAEIAAGVTPESFPQLCYVAPENVRDQYSSWYEGNWEIRIQFQYEFGWL